MKLTDLCALTVKPPLYEKGTKNMWTDEYISSQLLPMHLNGNTDAASRKKGTIETTLNRILSIADKQEMSILDLGCGPGLYAELCTERGHKVTGIDFSRRSVEYARRSAMEKSLAIDYIDDNYLNLSFENEFDLAFIIYNDFSVLLPDEQGLLLERIYKALKPGGMLAFDVINDLNIEQKVIPQYWEAKEAGFWSPGPYIELAGSFLYKEESVLLKQHIIIYESFNYDVYRFWIHFFGPAALNSLLTGHGFTDIETHNDFLPAGDIWSGENVTLCVARKSILPLSTRPLKRTAIEKSIILFYRLLQQADS